MKIRFLDPDVEKEVTADPMLFLAWCLTRDPYDDEDKFFHQEWYKRSAVGHEREALVYLREQTDFVLRRSLTNQDRLDMVRMLLQEETSDKV